MMQDLNLPSYDFRIRKESGQTQIFDETRKKYVALTPEEWVRQHFVKFMINDRQVPASLITIEKNLVFNKMNRRADVVAHSRQGDALMIVECKAPEIKISQDTFDQIVRYNSVLRVPFLVVTNGIDHYCCRMDYQKNSYDFLKDIPSYHEMTDH